MNFESENISTPKRRNVQVDNRLSWYSYYAGYSPQFASDVIKRLKADGDSIILDPWNGIGMTTHAASAAGCMSKGYDLNPATIIIAKALSISLGDKPSVIPLMNEIVSKALKIKNTAKVDPLSVWFSVNTSQYIRSVERAIQYCLVIARRQDYKFVHFRVEAISEIAAFFYLALFKAVRALIRKFTGSNPTWIKKPKQDSEKLDLLFAEIRLAFENEVNLMLKSFLPLFNESRLGEVELGVGDSTNILCDNDSVDFVISSPPYCTRIDYAVSMLPELAILGFANEEFNVLRRKLIGSTTVPSKQAEILDDWGQNCNIFLNRLKTHSSKASGTYYLKNHIQYFDLIYKSMSEISRVLKKRADCVLVVQDSYYKEIRIDLPLIVSEMAYNVGLAAENILDFSARNNMAEVNLASRKYRSASPAVESVLFFKKY